MITNLAKELLKALLDTEAEQLTGHERDYQDQMAVINEARRIAGVS